jgi:hypothetical protein
MVTNILSQLHSLSEADLLAINSSVIRQLKHVRRLKSMNARSEFSVGDKVGFGEHGGRGKRAYKEGTLHAIKRTRAEVKVGHMTWTVPLNMLEAL